MSKYVALLGVGLIFGLFGVLINYNALMFGDYFQVFLRNSAALVLLVPIIYFRNIRFDLTARDYTWLLLYSLVVVIAFTTATLAYVNADIKVVLAVRYFISLILSLIVSALLLSERTTFVQVLSLTLAIVGLCVFAYPINDFWSPGVLFAAVTATGFLCANYIIKAVPLKAEVLMFVEFLSVTVLIGVLMLAVDAPLVIGYSALGLLSAIVFPILLIAVTYLIIYGFRRSNFNLANIMMTAEIPFGILLGFLLLGQSISLIEFFGIALIFIAVVLPHIVSLLRDKSSKYTQPSDGVVY